MEDINQILEKLEKLVGKELDKIVAKGDINPAELELANKAVCLIEKIKMVDELDYMYDEDHSYSRSNRSYRQGMRSNNGNYSRNYYAPDWSYDYQITDRGYSGHSVRDRMISQLEGTMMDQAQSESEKRVIESLISQLGSSKY